MPARLRLMVTNDDGVYAPGIIALACTLAEIAEVVVIAPDRPRSGAGHAITLHKPLRMHRAPHPKYQQAGVEAWGTTGTPADCVILATHEVYHGELPDLLISGINSGPNVGDDVTYSGTVAAAMEASLMGIPGMATSMGWFGTEFHYWDAARAIRSLVEHWGEERPAPGTLWNVNCPNEPLANYAGVMFTRLGHRTFRDTIARRVDPKGNPYYWIAGDEFQADLAEGTDTWALKQHLMSITPITMDMTHERELTRLGAHAAHLSEDLKGISGFESPGPDVGEMPYASAERGE